MQNYSYNSKNKFNKSCSKSENLAFSGLRYVAMYLHMFPLWLENKWYHQRIYSESTCIKQDMGHQIGLKNVSTGYSSTYSYQLRWYSKQVRIFSRNVL